MTTQAEVILQVAYDRLKDDQASVSNLMRSMLDLIDVDEFATCRQVMANAVPSRLGLGQILAIASVAADIEELEEELVNYVERARHYLETRSPQHAKNLLRYLEEEKP